MKKYAGFRNGYVRVRIYGEQTERFLNLCRAREIRISDLRRESELSLTGCLQIRDFSVSYTHLTLPTTSRV